MNLQHLALLLLSYVPSSQGLPNKIRPEIFQSPLHVDVYPEYLSVGTTGRPLGSVNVQLVRQPRGQAEEHLAENEEHGDHLNHQDNPDSAVLLEGEEIVGSQQDHGGSPVLSRPMSPLTGSGSVPQRNASWDGENLPAGAVEKRSEESADSDSSHSVSEDPLTGDRVGENLVPGVVDVESRESQSADRDAARETRPESQAEGEAEDHTDSTLRGRTGTRFRGQADLVGPSENHSRGSSTRLPTNSSLSSTVPTVMQSAVTSFPAAAIPPEASVIISPLNRTTVSPAEHPQGGNVSVIVSSQRQGADTVEASSSAERNPSDHHIRQGDDSDVGELSPSGGGFDLPLVSPRNVLSSSITTSTTPSTTSSPTPSTTHHDLSSLRASTLTSAAGQGFERDTHQTNQSVSGNPDLPQIQLGNESVHPVQANAHGRTSLSLPTQTTTLPLPSAAIADGNTIGLQNRSRTTVVPIINPAFPQTAAAVLHPVYPLNSSSALQQLTTTAISSTTLLSSILTSAAHNSNENVQNVGVSEAPVSSRGAFPEIRSTSRAYFLEQRTSAEFLPEGAAVAETTTPSSSSLQSPQTLSTNPHGIVINDAVHSTRVRAASDDAPTSSSLSTYSSSTKTTSTRVNASLESTTTTSQIHVNTSIKPTSTKEPMDILESSTQSTTRASAASVHGTDIMAGSIQSTISPGQAETASEKLVSDDVTSASPWLSSPPILTTGRTDSALTEYLEPLDHSGSGSGSGTEEYSGSGMTENQTSSPQSPHTALRERPTAAVVNQRPTAIFTTTAGTATEQNHDHDGRKSSENLQEGTRSSTTSSTTDIDNRGNNEDIDEISSISKSSTYRLGTMTSFNQWRSQSSYKIATDSTLSSSSISTLTRTTGSILDTTSQVMPPLSSAPVYIEVKLQMTWNEFCSNIPVFCLELVEILRQYGRQESFSADQIRILENPRKTCDLRSAGRPSEERVIDVRLYLLNKSHHYDVILTHVCASVIKEGFAVRDSSVFQNKLLKVQLHELTEQQPLDSSAPGASDTVLDSDDNEFINEPGVTIVISIAAVGGVCCAALIIIQIILRRRYRKGIRTHNRSYSITSIDSIALNNVTKSRPSSGLFNPAVDVDSWELSHPLNLTKLANFALDLQGIYEEFQRIPNKTPRLSVVPSGAEERNRFANILPIPDTRVVLEKHSGNEVCSFINANYVSGYSGQARTYIATQAPLDATVGDFWTMVWEQRSPAIVMLINPQENGFTKCATYFPDWAGAERALVFGEFSVTMTKRDVHQEYITSWLQVKLIKTGECHDVRHFWLTCWPLSGRPDPISLVRFVLDSRPQYEDSGAPLIVHCSNGTARTGTFIALDICMRQLEHRRNVNVMRCVHSMRQQRAGCVQTSEQYCMLYQALNEYAAILSSPIISTASSAATLHAMLP